MQRLAGLLALWLAATPCFAGPKVIASVVPVYAIVAAVMGDTGQPELLLSGKVAEHRAVFTASQIADLGNADLVFIIGQGLEGKLAQLSGSEAVNGRIFVALNAAPGVHILPVRQGGVWEAHDHGLDPETQTADDQEPQGGVLAFDPHVWLDPENAKAMAQNIAAELSRVDPGNSAAYFANSTAFEAVVTELTTEIAADLAQVKDRPYVVFHDAYQYFERRFGLDGVGAISDVSAQAPSAERLKEIRDKIAASGAFCVFREPQYDDRVVATVIEGSVARAGVLDPLGSVLVPSAQAYPQLLRNLAADLKECLER